MDYITALLWTGVITLVLLMIEINFTYATKGFLFGWSSNRDPNTEFSPLAKRIKNAYNNQVDSAAYSVPVLAAAALSGLDSANAETAALIFVLGRAAYAPLYFIGVGNLRLWGFGASVLALIYIIYSLVISGLLV